ncbi:secreted antigen 1 [Babesia caballi]|uniref:Secreted antigen 1 n=1 Tax=Babesia caballi TaxID=5871 RepID=A0AAV4LNF7_BABCB|nr:secreted antigen 1 [Babesia caballi]
MTGCTNVPPPKSLKDALDFAGVLCVNNGLKDLVGKELEDRVAKALGLRDPPKSVADGGNHAKTISQNFNDVLTKLNELRELIIDTSHHGSYESYDSLKESSHDASCVDVCVTHILGVLPQLYGTLSYLKFKVDSSNGNLGGGGWSVDKCNAVSNGATGTLSAWLKDSNTSPAGVPSAVESDVKLLPGGYKTVVLSSQTGGTLKSKVGALVTGAGGGDGGYLHNLLLDVCLISEFSTCNISVYLVILAALSENATSSFQNDITRYPGLEAVLKTLHDTLNLFTPEQSGGEDAYLTALFKGSPHVYSKRLINTVAKHLEWLNGILTSLTASLNTLKGDSTKWEQTDLQEAKTSGLFGYSFSFGGKWKSNWDDNCKNQIPEATNKLIDDLTTFQQILKQHFLTTEPNGSGSSAGSIAGSLLGTATLGGAGAAVALNVGGVTTALKGAIGIFK